MQDAVIVDNPVIDLVRTSLERSPLFTANGGPLAASFEEGDPDSRVLLIAGDNASGKSFLVRVLAAKLNEAKVEPVQVSMRYRTMSGLHRSFMYGAGGDAEDSTGNVSLIALRGALRTVENRQTPSWLMLDEPDTGLAEGYCGALGTYLADFGNRMPVSRCEGFTVVTHSRRLVSSMLFSLKKKPHFLCFSDYAADDLLEAWLEDGRDRTVEELLGLGETSITRFRQINRLLQEAQADKEAFARRR